MLGTWTARETGKSGNTGRQVSCSQKRAGKWKMETYRAATEKSSVGGCKEDRRIASREDVSLSESVVK